MNKLTKAKYAVHLEPGDVISYVGDSSNTYESAEVLDVLHEFAYESLVDDKVEALLSCRGEVVRQSFDIDEFVELTRW